MRAHSIFRGAVEGFDSEMLFDPAKEQLDLPTTPVQVGDGEGRKQRVVSEKNESLARVWIDITDTPEPFGIVASRNAVIQ